MIHIYWRAIPRRARLAIMQYTATYAISATLCYAIGEWPVAIGFTIATVVMGSQAYYLGRKAGFDAGHTVGSRETALRLIRTRDTKSL